MSGSAEFRARVEEAGRVHLDARVLAYHLLGQEPEVGLTRLLFAAIQERAADAQTSAVSLYQLLAEPYRRGESEVAEETGKLLTGLRGLDVVPLTASLAGQAAQVRARLGTGAAASIQIATAVTEGADLFLTDGSGLRRVAGVRVENLEDYL